MTQQSCSPVTTGIYRTVPTLHGGDSASTETGVSSTKRHNHSFAQNQVLDSFRARRPAVYGAVCADKALPRGKISLVQRNTVSDGPFHNTHYRFSEANPCPRELGVVPNANIAGLTMGSGERFYRSPETPAVRARGTH